MAAAAAACVTGVIISLMVVVVGVACHCVSNCIFNRTRRRSQSLLQVVRLLLGHPRPHGEIGRRKHRLSGGAAVRRLTGERRFGSVYSGVQIGASDAHVPAVCMTLVAGIAS